jgi:hypothetical protein
MPEVLKIEKIRRICNRCQKEFVYGDEVVSAVLSVEEELARQDFCLDCWKKPPDEVFSYWRAIFPEKAKPNIEDMDKVQVFLDKLLEKTDTTPQIDGVKFFAALVLARKKRVKLLGTRVKDGQEWLLIEKNWDGEKVEIADPGINEEQIEEIRRSMESLFEIELSGS